MIMDNLLFLGSCRHHNNRNMYICERWVRASPLSPLPSRTFRFASPYSDSPFFLPHPRPRFHSYQMSLSGAKAKLRRPLTVRGFSSPYSPLPPSNLATLALGILFQLYTILLEPLFCHLHLTTPGGSDATYGRKNIPFNQWERQLVFENPEVEWKRGIAYLNGEAIQKAGSWDRPGSASFVSYTVFWIPESLEKGGLQADVLLLHGINDYSGKLVPHGYHFAKAGFRVIVLDLPTFGRSSGLHAYLPSMRILVEAVHAVLYDLRSLDTNQGTKEVSRRKLFLEGHSMGGFTALYTAAIYPPQESEQDKEVDALIGEDWRPRVDGIAVAAPMIGISPESRPGPIVELIARVLRFFVGRLPLASAVRGNVSDDERVETEFHLDPMTYKGKLRIATGLAILEGLQHLHTLTDQIHCPVSMHHGDHDRATSWKSSKEFFDKLPNEDKEYRLWKGYEHVMMKNVKNQSEEDDKKRDVVLNAITEWLVKQAKK